MIKHIFNVTAILAAIYVIFSLVMFTLPDLSCIWIVKPTDGKVLDLLYQNQAWNLNGILLRLSILLITGIYALFECIGDEEPKAKPKLPTMTEWFKKDGVLIQKDTGLLMKVELMNPTADYDSDDFILPSGSYSSSEDRYYWLRRKDVEDGYTDSNGNKLEFSDYTDV